MNERTKAYIFQFIASGSLSREEISYSIVDKLYNVCDSNLLTRNLLEYFTKTVPLHTSYSLTRTTSTYRAVLSNSRTIDRFTDR